MPVLPQLYTGIKYIRIHKNDLDGLSLGDSFTFANSLTVGHSNGNFIYTIESITKDTNNPSVYYLQVKANKSTSPADTSNALVVYQPNLDQDVDYNEYNALFGNAVDAELSNIHYLVDRNNIQALPTNIDSIINGSAPRVAVSNQLTGATGYSNARYEGTRLNAKILNKYTQNDITYGNSPVLESKVPYFATFDQIQQTSDIGGVLQYNIPYVVDVDGKPLPSRDTNFLYEDMPLIFTEKKIASSAVRFSEFSPADQQRQQRKFTDNFEIYKGGTDVWTLAASTSGSVNSKGDTLTVKSGSFFDDIFFGEDTGVGNYTVEATFSGSDAYRTQVTKNTEYIVDYVPTYNPESLMSSNTYSFPAGQEAECDLQFNSTILLAYDRDGTGWKKDMKTIVTMEIATDAGGTNWTPIREITIPRFWTRGDINESQIPNDVYLLGYRKIDGITGVYLAVNLVSGFRPFGGTNSHKVRTVVRYETSGNDDCFVHSKFEFTDNNGNRIVNGLATAGGTVAGAAGALGTAAAGGVSFGLSTTGAALAVLAGPVALGAAIGGLTIGAILFFRNQFGKIKYKDTGVNQYYVRVIFKDNLPPVLYSEFKVSQEIEPDVTLSMLAPPFSRSLGGPTSTDVSPINIHYGQAGNPWLALSPGLLAARGKVQSSTQHESLGFKDFIYPLSFQAGDQIKFEGNEKKVHTIVEVVPQQAGLPNTLRGHYYSMIKVDPPVPGSTWVKNFQVRRFVQDPSKVLLRESRDASQPNKIQFTSSSLKGTLVPQYITDTLEENFADYKQDLISKGIIS